MTVEELLRSKGARIISVRMDESVEMAARLLKREGIGAVVVKDVCGTEGDVIVGMFSERDIVRALVDHGAAVLKMPVSALMSRDVVRCGPRDDIGHVMALMSQHQIRHVPVLDEHTLVGVVTVQDVIGASAGHAGPGAGAIAGGGVNAAA